MPQVTEQKVVHVIVEGLVYRYSDPYDGDVIIIVTDVNYDSTENLSKGIVLWTDDKDYKIGETFNFETCLLDLEPFSGALQYYKGE